VKLLKQTKEYLALRQQKRTLTVAVAVFGLAVAANLVFAAELPVSTMGASRY
jgi:hypothetical protein